MKSWSRYLTKICLVVPLLGAGISPPPPSDIYLSNFHWSGTLKKDGATLKELSGVAVNGVAHIQLTPHKSCDLTFMEKGEMVRGTLKCHRDYVILSLTFYSQYLRKGESPFIFETPKGQVQIDIRR